MSDVMSAISDLIQEELQYVRMDLEPSVDPFFSTMINTSEGVIQKGVGTDFEVDHVMSTGVSGYVEDDSPMGDVAGEVGQSVVFTPPTGSASKWDDTTRERTFPLVGEMAHQGTLKKTLKLVQGRGGFALPLQYFLADALSSTIKKLVSSEVRAVARMLAQHEANTFYAKDQTNRWIATAPQATACTPVDGSEAYIDIDLSVSGTTGRVRRFYPGQPVRLFLDGTMLNDEDPMIVLRVGHVDQTVRIGTMDGTATVDAVEGGTTVQVANMSVSGTQYGATRIWGPSGIYYWLDDDSTNLYGINQVTHPQFQSIINTSLGTVLDEPTLNKYISGFYEAYEGMWDLDGFLTTKGVINAYFEAASGLQRYERLGKRLKLAEGWSQLDFEYDGTVFQFATSSYLDKGEFIAYKFQDNIRRYGIPDLPSSTKHAEFNDVLFLGPWFGSSSIFLPAFGSAAPRLTEFVQAPFYMIRERCPEQLPGVLLQGVEELTL